MVDDDYDEAILGGMQDDLIDGLPPSLRGKVLAHMAGKPQPQPRRYNTEAPRLGAWWWIRWTTLAVLSLVWGGVLGLASIPLFVVFPVGLAVFLLGGLPSAACVVWLQHKLVTHKSKGDIENG